MFNTENFEKVMKIENSYSAISKRSENVFGFGGIRSATSYMMVSKPPEGAPINAEYIIILGVENEWGKTYMPFGYYIYYIRKDGIFVDEQDWETKEKLGNYFPMPTYYSENMKEHFYEVFNYLKEKVAAIN